MVLVFLRFARLEVCKRLVTSAQCAQPQQRHSRLLRDMKSNHRTCGSTRWKEREVPSRYAKEIRRWMIVQHNGSDSFQ